MMDIAEVRSRIRSIKASKGDNEVAHSKQDELYEDVLRAIARGADRALAREALKVQKIEFERWCA